MEAQSPRIYITDQDFSRLRRSIPMPERLNGADKLHLRRLHEALKAAIVVPPQQIPPYVITMNTRFRLKDVETAHESEYTLVFPGRANIRQGMISVLAPAGAALIGAQELETVSVLTPVGVKHFEVAGITYQPEAAEEYDS